MSKVFTRLPVSLGIYQRFMVALIARAPPVLWLHAHAALCAALASFSSLCRHRGEDPRWVTR